MNLRDVLSRFEGIRKTGTTTWIARCPAHDDHRPSLSIAVGRDDRVLVHCHAGCAYSEILEAADLESHDLIPGHSGGPRKLRPHRDQEEAEVRAFYEHLCRVREPPDARRMREELLLLGRLILGGIPAWRASRRPASRTAIRTFPLRLIYQAMEELVSQGTPRRWFSPLAMWREIERVGGDKDHRAEVFFWSKMAVAAVRSATLEHSEDVT